VTASEKAHALLAGVRKLDDEWARAIGGLGEPELRAPSALPGWSRAHVLAHVARNADGVLNLLTWANTGVETPMYASDEARDEDIEAGVRRGAADILADFVASAGRFEQYAAAMPDEAWPREVRNRQGAPVTAAGAARMRLSELTIHLADLDRGYDLDRVLGLLGPLTEDGVAPGRRRLRVDDGRRPGGDRPRVRRGAAGLAERAFGRCGPRRRRPADPRLGVTSALCQVPASRRL
jgi:maleylpyruvate isomerase